MNKKVIITGCCGFIGTNLSKKYLNDGYVVIGVDNFMTSNMDNVKTLSSYTNFKLHNISIEDLQSSKDFEDAECIWNLACPASPIHYRKHPIDVIHACTIGVEKLCKIAIENDIPLIHTSTSEVYGSTNTQMHENNWGYVNCYGPRSCYDEGKRVAETIIYEYEKNYGLKAYIFRLFNTFGPHMSINDGRVIPNFMISCLKNIPYPIFGDSTKTRTFNYVDTTVNQMFDIVKMNAFGLGPINIGCNKYEYTLDELAWLINESCSENKSRSPQMLIKDHPIDDPHHRKPNLTKLSAILSKIDKHPNDYISYSFEKSLQKTYDYFKHLSLTNKEEFEKITLDTMKTY